jgi:cytoskeletal protein CcmA (bactofilin family)
MNRTARTSVKFPFRLVILILWLAGLFSPLSVQAQSIARALETPLNYRISAGFELNAPALGFRLINPAAQPQRFSFEPRVPNGFGFIGIERMVVVSANSERTHRVGVLVEDHLAPGRYDLELDVRLEGVVVETLRVTLQLETGYATSLSVRDEFGRRFEGNYVLRQRFQQTWMSLAEFDGTVFDTRLPKGTYQIWDEANQQAYDFVVESTQELVWERSLIQQSVQALNGLSRRAHRINLEVFKDFDAWLILERQVYEGTRLVSVTPLLRQRSFSQGVLRVEDPGDFQTTLNTRVRYRWVDANQNVRLQSPLMRVYPWWPWLQTMLGAAGLALGGYLIVWARKRSRFDEPTPQRRRSHAPVALEAEVPFHPSVVIAQEDYREGDLITDEDLELAGRVVGSVISRGRVLMRSMALVAGSIHAQELYLAGVVYGDVFVDQVHLTKTAVVRGSLFIREMTIESGARIEGRVNQS